MTGRVERGVVKVGDEVEMVGLRPTASTVVTGVEMFRKVLDEGQAGTTLGCCCGDEEGRGGAGMVLAKPKSITPHTKFKAEVYVLTKEEGAAHAVFQRVSAAVLFSDDGRDGVVQLPAGVEMVMPGTT